MSGLDLSRMIGMTQPVPHDGTRLFVPAAVMLRGRDGDVYVQYAERAAVNWTHDFGADGSTTSIAWHRAPGMTEAFRVRRWHVDTPWSMWGDES